MGHSPQEPVLSWTLLSQLSLLPASISKSPQSDSWVSHKGRGGRFIFQPHYCPDFGEGRIRSVALDVYLRRSRWVVEHWALVCVGGTHSKDWQLCCSGLSTASLAAGLAQVLLRSHARVSKWFLALLPVTTNCLLALLEASLPASFSPKSYNLCSLISSF